MSERQATPCRAVTAWLLLMACAVAAMVSIGGITRLTESGLSMVEWRPLIGWLPPLSEAEWQRIFALYRETPEFRQVNFAIDLEGFRAIFWWEYVHRLWGRLLGVFFILPLGLVLAPGPDRPAAPAAPGFAAGARRAAGADRLVDGAKRPRRPAGCQRGEARRPSRHGAPHLRAPRLDRARPHPPAAGAPAAVRLAAVRPRRRRHRKRRAGRRQQWRTHLQQRPAHGRRTGAADDYRSDRNWVADALENPVAAQLHHRILALAAVLGVAAAWLRAGGLRAGGSEHLLLVAVLLQAGLGVAALLAVVPLGLAALHQFGAVLLLAAALLRTHGAHPSPQV